MLPKKVAMLPYKLSDILSLLYSFYLWGVMVG